VRLLFLSCNLYTLLFRRRRRRRRGGEFEPVNSVYCAPSFCGGGGGGGAKRQRRTLPNAQCDGRFVSVNVAHNMPRSLPP